jgi:hypothetical protein
MEQKGGQNANQKGGAGVFYRTAGDKQEPPAYIFFNEILFNPETIVENIINSSLSGIMLILRIPPKVVRKYNLRTIDEATMNNSRPVTRIIVKLVVVTEDDRFLYEINGKRKQAEKEGDFIQEINIQNYLFEESLLGGEPICPAIMFSAIVGNALPTIKKLLRLRSSNKKVNGEIKRTFNGMTAGLKIALEDEDIDFEDSKLGVIGMEIAEGYETVYNHLRKAQANARFTGKPVPQKKLAEITREINKRFYTLYKLGYFHGDGHQNNVMLNKDTGRSLIIDFGRTEVNNQKVDTYRQYYDKLMKKEKEWLTYHNPEDDGFEFNPTRWENMSDLLKTIPGMDSNFLLLNNEPLIMDYRDLADNVFSQEKSAGSEVDEGSTTPSLPSEENSSSSTPRSDDWPTESWDESYTPSPSRTKPKPKTKSKPKSKSKPKPKSKSKTQKAVGCKGISLTECDNKTGCKVARGAKRSFCRSATNKKKQPAKGAKKAPVKKTVKKAPVRRRRAKQAVQGCRGLSPSKCATKTGCTVARGAKRTFCRTQKNKKN